MTLVVYDSWTEMFKKKAQTPYVVAAEIERARRRVQRMTIEEMLNWADLAGSDMMRLFRAYRKDPNSLEDIRLAVVGLTAIYEELQSRDLSTQR